MRNLRSIHCSKARSRIPAASCWDVSSDSIICAFGPSQEDVYVELRRWRKGAVELELITAFEAPCPLPDLKHDIVLNVQHFSGSGITCLVFAGGDLVLVREQPGPNEDKIEIVGSVEAGELMSETKSSHLSISFASSFVPRVFGFVA